MSELHLRRERDLRVRHGALRVQERLVDRGEVSGGETPFSPVRLPATLVSTDLQNRSLLSNGVFSSESGDDPADLRGDREQAGETKDLETDPTLQRSNIQCPVCFKNG